MTFFVSGISLFATMFFHRSYFWIVLFQINNPDMRVQILKEYVKENFPDTPLLDYALEVEKITTSKVTTAVTNPILTFPVTLSIGNFVIHVTPLQPLPTI